MFSVLLALLAVQDPVAPAPVAAPVAEVVTEAAASPAALPVVRVRPIETNSEAGMAVGHSGSATVEVDMQPDGTRSEVLLVESSRSDILDAEAISLITGATLRAPESASRYRIEVVFQPYGFLEMTCRSFALQARWFQQTWPEKSVKDSTLYTASVGLMTLALMGQGGTGDTQAMLRPVREMEATWPRLIVECERQPNRPYGQVLARLMR